MSNRRLIGPFSRRLLTSCVLAGIVVLAVPAIARAESCSYDPTLRSVTASITPGGSAVLDVAGGQIRFGNVPAPCGDATTTNTDSIAIAGNAGTDEQLTLDERSGVFGPGMASESNFPEIEISTSLGDATDTVVVYLTAGNDRVAAGQNGVALNSDGDVDVTFSPSAFRLEFYPLEGNDYVNGRGESGAGLHFLGPMVIDGGPGDDLLVRGSSEPDVLTGGLGNDRIDGQEGPDLVDGGPGDDVITSGGGDDDVTGGPGSDSMAASSGNDTIFAEDDTADSQINGGPGTDTAFYDVGVDPTPLAVENKISDAFTQSCTYNSSTGHVSAAIASGGTATLQIVGGEIRFGLVPQPCQGATSTNTESISIAGNAGSTERLVLDQRTGLLGPGVSPEFNFPEIEISASLGDDTDTIALFLTDDADHVSPGQNGIALNSDGDVDVTLSPGAPHLEIYALQGNDYVNGRGEGGSGLAYLGPIVIDGGPGDDSLIRGSFAVDTLTGGEGDDVIDAQDGADLIDAGPGNDTISAGGGNDQMTGGPGSDSFAGSDGDDVIHADDGEADTQINGGPGTDTAFYDAGIDPTPVAVETLIGDPPPPPPPGGTCSFNAATRIVTAQVGAGTEAVLRVAGSEIWFGVTPEPCAGATTANTDRINVVGGTGSAETLTVDQSTGTFAPGFTAESTGVAEIEIDVSLGNATDRVIVLGTPANDSIAAGGNGVGLNTDADVDVTFSPVPALLEIHGLGGTNTLTGRGGQGAGAVFAGRLLLVGGDGGDTLRGGLGADELRGGLGADVIEGREDADVLLGGAGNDTLAGGAGSDDMTGGAGADSFAGSDGDDVLRAVDGEADTSLSGGPGTDTAFYDAALDPSPVAVENRFPS